jgi:hypothetical protein
MYSVRRKLLNPRSMRLLSITILFAIIGCPERNTNGQVRSVIVKKISENASEL